MAICYFTTAGGVLLTTYAGQRWKKFRRHLDSKFLEGLNSPGDVPISNVHDRQIVRTKAPPRHDLDESPLVYQMRLHERRKFSNSDAGEQCRCYTYIVVDCQVRLKTERFFVGPVCVSKSPATTGCPSRESQEAVVEQVLGFWERENLQGMPGSPGAGAGRLKFCARRVSSP